MPTQKNKRVAGIARKDKFKLKEKGQKEKQQVQLSGGSSDSDSSLSVASILNSPPSSISSSDSLNSHLVSLALSPLDLSDSSSSPSDMSASGSPADGSVEESEAANSNGTFTRISRRLMGEKISFNQFEEIKETKLDNRFRDNTNLGSAYGRFESRKRSHCVVGIDSLPESPKKKVLEELERTSDVQTNCIPGTPSPRKATIRHMWTPKRTTKLQESTRFKIGDKEISIYVDRKNSTKPTGNVALKATLNNLLEVLNAVDNTELASPAVLSSSPPENNVSSSAVSSASSDTASNTSAKPSASTQLYNKCGMAVFSSKKYTESLKRNIKATRSQNNLMGMSAGKYVEQYGLENRIEEDRRSAMEWLDGLSRDLLYRAATTIEVNNILCKIVLENLNLISLDEEEPIICTQEMLAAAPRGANTYMMVAEQIVRLLLSMGNDVTVRYQFICSVPNIADEIHYFIDTAVTDTIRFEFDSKKYDTPTSIESKLVSAVVKQIVESARKESTVTSLTPAGETEDDNFSELPLTQSLSQVNSGNDASPPSSPTKFTM